DIALDPGPSHVADASHAHYTPPPSGDKGGNGFKLKGEPNNLHSYWDDLLDLDHASDPNGVPSLTDAQIITRAKAVATAHPAAGLSGPISKLDPADWAKESFAFRTFVY